MQGWLNTSGCTCKQGILSAEQVVIWKASAYVHLLANDCPARFYTNSFQIIPRLYVVTSVLLFQHDDLVFSQDRMNVVVNGGTVVWDEFWCSWCFWCPTVSDTDVLGWWSFHLPKQSISFDDMWTRLNISRTKSLKSCTTWESKKFRNWEHMA